MGGSRSWALYCLTFGMGKTIHKVALFIQRCAEIKHVIVKLSEFSQITAFVDTIDYVI